MEGKIATRDSKDPAGPVLVYSAAQWREFVSGVKSGALDNLA